MRVSESTLKWVLRFYPPLLFQRIWVKRFDKGFMGVEVKICKSILNLNYNRSIFGGTIYSAADPFFAVLFYQALLKRGYKALIWQKAADIDYIKPGFSDLYFRIRLEENDLLEACEVLDTDGRFVRSFPIEINDKHGEICARVNSVVYIRKLNNVKTEIL